MMHDISRHMVNGGSTVWFYYLNFNHIFVLDVPVPLVPIIGSRTTVPINENQPFLPSKDFFAHKMAKSRIFKIA